MNDRPPNYLQGNVEAWQEKAAGYVAAAEQAWASDQPYWGIWRIPEREACLLPADMSGLTAIELGCGTAYVSAWMCRRGAKVVAIDPTSNQLKTAQRLQKEHQLDFELELGFAESVAYVRPGIVRVSGADDNLNSGIDPPNVLDGLESVPARRHTHVNKGQLVRAPLLAGLRDLVTSFFSL